MKTPTHASCYSIRHLQRIDVCRPILRAQPQSCSAAGRCYLPPYLYITIRFGWPLD